MMPAAAVVEAAPAEVGSTWWEVVVRGMRDATADAARSPATVDTGSLSTLTTATPREAGAEVRGDWVAARSTGRALRCDSAVAWSSCSGVAASSTGQPAGARASTSGAHVSPCRDRGGGWLGAAVASGGWKTAV